MKVVAATVLAAATYGSGSIYDMFMLTKNKAQNKSLDERKMRKFHLVENIVLLTVAGMVNAASPFEYVSLQKPI